MPNWKGSNRKSRLPSDWAVIRLDVLRRDHHRCQHVREDTGRKCGRRAEEVDHIVAGADDHRRESLQALCTWHHGQKSGREGGVASGRARRAKRDAAKPVHPGLIEPIAPTPTRCTPRSTQRPPF